METKCNKLLDSALFAIIVLVILLVIILLSANMISQYINYGLAIDAALSDTKAKAPDHAAIITYSRSWDFAIIKTSSLFISLLIIFIGSLYVLRVAESPLAVSVQAEPFHGTLLTSSPGLVMALFGVILAIFSLNSDSKVTYKSPSWVVRGIEELNFEESKRKPQQEFSTATIE